MTTALVLSGGGSLGVAHAGALRVLEKNFSFTHFYGVSAGSIVCAAAACGKTADQISKIFHSLNIFSLAFDFSAGNFGLLRGEKVMKFLEQIFEEKTFEELKKEGKFLRVFATDFDNGERVLLSSGSIAKAVRASISVPILFDPFWYQEKWLVDGGLSGNFPLLDAIQDFSGEKILAVDVATSLKKVDLSEKKFFGKAMGMRQIMEKTFRILYKTQNANIPKDDRVHIFQPNLSDFTTLDIGKWNEMEKKGEESVSL